MQNKTPFLQALAAYFEHILRHREEKISSLGSVYLMEGKWREIESTESRTSRGRYNIEKERDREREIAWS